jgi:transmembrane sensor
MTDLGREIAQVVRVDWSDPRARAAEAGVHLRRRRRTVARATAGAFGGIALVVGATLAMWPGPGDSQTPVVSRLAAPVRAPVPPSPSSTLRFDDGSTASPIGTNSELRLAAVQPGKVEIELVAGAGTFHVVEDRARLFRVTRGVLRVEAFGATFACARSDQRVRVEVFDGSLRVAWDDEQRELHAGDRGVFPPDAPPRPPAPAIEPLRPRSHVARVTDKSWRDLADDGDYERAFSALQAAGVPAVRDVPDELLLAADVARLSHHPADAIAPLRRILHDHADDPRAPLAAFTLGRVLLEELGRPAEAADAFAQADRLAPDGPMAEDAVAREVEARSRAGDTDGAKQLAEEYLRRFPDGRKVRSVKRFGGLE